MIVRIATEGQYQLDSSYLDRLNAIDNEIVGAIGANDPERFASLFSDLLGLVRQKGRPVDPEELLESQFVLPPPDTTFEEAQNLFTEQGLVPD